MTRISLVFLSYLYYLLPEKEKKIRKKKKKGKIKRSLLLERDTLGSILLGKFR